jgi:hypothetical protein
LIGDGRRQRDLIVLDAENHRQAARRAQVDCLVPFAERRSAFADERHGDAARSFAREGHGHAGNRQRRDRERRRRRQDAPVEITRVQVFAVERCSGLPHLGAEHHPDGLRLASHGEHRAQVPDHRRDHVAVPPVVVSAVCLAAAQPYAGRIHGFLSERSKSLALKRHPAVSHLAIREKRLQPVVGRPRQDHPAQHLDPFLARQRRFDGGAPQESVTVVEDLTVCQLHSSFRSRSRCGLGKPGRERPRLQPARELTAERRTKRIDAGLGRGRAAALDGSEGIDRFGERQRMPLGDEAAKAHSCKRCHLLHHFVKL